MSLRVEGLVDDQVTLKALRGLVTDVLLMVRPVAGQCQQGQVLLILYEWGTATLEACLQECSDANLPLLWSTTLPSRPRTDQQQQSFVSLLPAIIKAQQRSSGVNEALDDTCWWRRGSGCFGVATARQSALQSYA